MSKKHLSLAMIGVLCVGCLTGCDTLTRERFDMINVDSSTKVDVQYTLGRPSTQLPDRWQYERPVRHLNVFVDFHKNGVVSRKQWIDAATGEWADTQKSGDSDTSESTTIRTKR